MITLEKVLTELKGETLNEIIGGTRNNDTTRCGDYTTRVYKKKKCKKDKKPKGCYPTPPCKPCSY